MCSKEKTIAHFGEAFYDKVSRDLDGYRARWGLYDIEQVDYYSVNCVFKCMSEKYGACILKIGLPCKENLTEYSALVEYGGERFCKAYEAEIENGALLIEQLIPSTKLREVQDVEKRVDIFCEIWSGLHKKPVGKSVYPSYMGWVGRITQYMKETAGYAELTAYMVRAEEICLELCRRYDGEMLLHGDLHHDNILLNADGRYYAVDPKGVIGHPLFDIPRFILNEFEADISEDFIKKYCYILKTLSKKLYICESELNMLVYVEMCMANCWSVESGQPANMRYVEFVADMLAPDINAGVRELPEASES